MEVQAGQIPHAG